MEGHAEKCLERFSDLANKNTSSLTLVQHHVLITTLYLLRTSSQKENSEMFVL